MDRVKMNETVSNNSPREQISHSVALCCQQWLLPLYRMQLIKSTDNFTEQQTHYISVKACLCWIFFFFLFVLHPNCAVASDRTAKKRPGGIRTQRTIMEMPGQLCRDDKHPNMCHSVSSCDGIPD